MMRYVLLILMFALSACGFTPMYGDAMSADGNQMQSYLNNIAIDNIPDQQGLQLRNHLIDRFYHNGRPADPFYELKFSPVIISKTDLDLTKNASATRSLMSVTVSMDLIAKGTGKSLLSRSFSSSASYDILDSRFTTRVSEDNAEQNAIEDLARQIEQQLVLYFHR